ESGRNLNWADSFPRQAYPSAKRASQIHPTPPIRVADSLCRRRTSGKRVRDTGALVAPRGCERCSWTCLRSQLSPPASAGALGPMLAHVAVSNFEAEFDGGRAR